MISLFLSKNERGIVVFKFFPNLKYEIRLIISFGLIFIGVLLQFLAPTVKDAGVNVVVDCSGGYVAGGITFYDCFEFKLTIILADFSGHTASLYIYPKIWQKTVSLLTVQLYVRVTVR